MGARPYHPALGRFLSTDLIEGGTPNDYTYVADPVNSFDLDGTWGIPNPIKAVGSAAKVVGAQTASVGGWLNENKRSIAKGSVIVAGIAGGIACAASVVCAVAVGAAAGAGSYLAADAGTDRFSWKKLTTSTAAGAAFDRVGAAGSKLVKSGATRLVAAASRRSRLYSNFDRVGLLRTWRIDNRIVRSEFRAYGAQLGGRTLQGVAGSGTLSCAFAARGWC